MKPEDKELLIRELYARAPYGVKVSKVIEDRTSDPRPIRSINLNNIIIEDGEFEDGTPDIDVWNYEDIKPYLFPLSSMTEEQCYKLASIRSGFQDCWKYIKTPIPLSICNFEQIDWFYKNHLDFRGLIPKGLAIDSTGLNIY